MESEEYIEISLSCNSSRQDAGVGCGISYENHGQPIDLNDTDWIWCGISECFWENFFEFEDGIAEAKAAIAVGKETSIEEALHKAFGEFFVEFWVNGEKTDLNYGIDIEDIIYNLLIEYSGIDI